MSRNRSIDAAAAAPPACLPAVPIDATDVSAGRSPRDSPLWWFRWVPAIAVTILLLQLLYVVGSVVLIPVLASFSIALVLNPLVSQLERRGMSRSLAALVSLVGVLVAVIMFIGLVLPGLWTQTVETGHRLTQLFTPENAQHARSILRSYSVVLDRSIGPWLEHVVREPGFWVSGSATWLTGALAGLASTAAASLDLLLVPFFVYYLLVDFSGWRNSAEALIPARFRTTFQRLFDEVGRIVESYITGQLLVGSVMAALYAVAFWMLGVPAWGAIAAISGLLNAIPYVGTVLGLVLATGFTLADGAELWRVIGVLATFFVVQNIEGFYLTPRILGGRLQLHPMAVFFGLLVGGKLFGLLGILLAVPTIAVSKVFITFFREMYLASSFYAGVAAVEGSGAVALDTRMALAAEHTLQEQGLAASGNELLAPAPETDDPAIRAMNVGRSAGDVD